MGTEAMATLQIAAIAAAAAGIAGAFAFSHRFNIRLRAVITASAGGIICAALVWALAQLAQSLAVFAGGLLLIAGAGSLLVWFAIRAESRLGRRVVSLPPDVMRLAATPHTPLSPAPYPSIRREKPATVPAAAAPWAAQISVPADSIKPVALPPSNPPQEGRVRKRRTASPKKPEATEQPAPPEESAPEPPAQEPGDEALNDLEKLAKGFSKEQERIARIQEKRLIELERAQREAAEKRREQESCARDAELHLVEKERTERQAEERRREEERLALEAEIQRKEKERAVREEERRLRERERRAHREEERRMREEKARQLAAETDEAQRIRDRIRAEKEKAAGTEEAEPEEKRIEREKAEGERLWLAEQQRLAREAQAKREAEAAEYMDVALRFVTLGMRIEALPWLEKAYRVEAGEAARAKAGVAIVECLTELGWKGEARKKMQAMKSELKIDAETRKKLEELAVKLLG